MGQYWKLIAPRLRAYKPLSGYKLGEFYFDVSDDGPNGLVYLLATPIAPQKVVKYRERHNKQPAEESQIGEQRFDSVSALSVTVQSSPTLMGLPTEVHRRVFDELEEDINAIVCLGTTSQHFWSIAKEYVHIHCKARFGRWAGEPLVCVGDYAKCNDYPPGLFSGEELEIMRQEGGDAPGGAGDFVDNDNDAMDLDVSFLEEAGKDTPKDSWRFRLQTYRHPDHTYQADMSGADLRRCMRSIYAENPGSKTINSDMEAIADMENYLPKSEAWILRNLTTKQLVRAEAIALEPEYVNGPFIHGPGLGHVILARICWSADPSSSMHDINNITRGVWAGHRFDIVTEKMHNEEAIASLGEAWEDVSDEVAQEVRSIWEANMGPEWRKLIDEFVARFEQYQ